MSVTQDRKEILDLLVPIARAASARIRQVYATAFSVAYKGKDDPVTLADRDANGILCEALTRAFPDIPIVSEESDAATFDARHASSRVWFVDPLDGTRDFVERNGDFVVMMGLAENGRAVLGVIDCPVAERCFVGALGAGAFEIRDGERIPIHVSDGASLRKARLVASRHRPSPELEARVKNAGIAAATRVGSAGLKALRVACGEADVYAHLGAAGFRWDACAPEAIVVAAGGTMTDAHGEPIDYAAPDLANARGVLATNGLLHAEMLSALR